MKRSNDRLYLAGFVAANLLLKVALVPLNQGEYTDGILQLTVFEHDSGYPPLYGAASKLLSLAGVSLETAGRLVSAIAGSLALIPVFLLARLLFGLEAAKISVLLFTVSPLVLRWAPRVMTDSLFLALSSGAVYLLIRAWTLLRDAEANECADCKIGMASILAAMAAFTRYQGVLLAPLVAMVVLVAWRRGRFPVRSIIGFIPWLGVSYWMVSHGGVHGGQFALRTAGSPLATLGVYWNTAESFVLISPYYFGYPVVALALAGWLRAPAFAPAVRPTWILYGLFALAILALQSRFLSFQYRYMLPVLPIVLVLAGAGGQWLHQASSGTRWRIVYRVGFTISVLYLAVFSMAVLVMQRQAFGDQKAAALMVKAAARPGQTIYSNEQYGSFLELGCPKLSFWTGQRVQPALNLQTSAVSDIKAGDWFIAGTHYGGREAMDRVIIRVADKVVLNEIATSPVHSEILPLMDDIMEQPGTSQSVIAWVMRFVPQRFTTRVFQVGGPR